MYNLDLDNAEEPEIKLPTSVGSQKKERILEKVYFCFIDYAKAFDCVDHNKLENSETDGEGQGSLVCCSPWGHKESDMME